MGEPDFYTVEEAADRLRIGRTSAYKAAKDYRQGRPDGLPVIAIRGTLRVPRRKLEEWAGGRLSDPEPADEPELVLGPPVLEVISNPDPDCIDSTPSTQARATRPSPQLDPFTPPPAS
jgi:hypothetical protein